MIKLYQQNSIQKMASLLNHFAGRSFGVYKNTVEVFVFCYVFLPIDEIEREAGGRKKNRKKREKTLIY